MEINDKQKTDLPEGESFMSEIVEKMRQEIINRSNLFEEETKGTKDEYIIYREHV